MYNHPFISGLFRLKLSYLIGYYSKLYEKDSNKGCMENF